MVASFFYNRKIINVFWMMSEKLISLFGLIFVTSYVAKYIGPESFGKLTYATTLFGLVRILAMMGLDDVFFQKISVNRLLGEKLIKASGLIRDSIFFISSIFFLIYFYFVTDNLTFIFSVSACLAVFFSTKDVYSIYFDALIMSKLNTICNVVGLITSMMIRYLIVYLSLPVEFFFFSIVSSSFIPFVIRSFLYQKNKKLNYKISKGQKRRYNRYLLLVSKSMLLYALSVQILIRISLFFLGNESNYDLGIFSIASTLSFGYFFILSSVITSFISQMYRVEGLIYKRLLYIKILAVLFLVFIFIFFFIYFFGDKIVILLYGDKYLQAVSIMPLLTVACFFSGINTLNEKYIIGFHGYNYLKKKKVLLMLFAILANYILIKRGGIVGAAYAILIIEFISMTLFSYFFRNMELLKAQFSFIQYIKKRF